MTLSRSLKLRVRPHEGQRIVIESKAFCTAAIAGTGGGKTVAGYIWLLINMIQRPGQIWVVAEPTSDMVDRILLTPAPGRFTLPEFLKHFDPEMVFLKSKGIIRHKLGTVIFASGERPESLQGAQLGGIWLDEAGLMKREAWLTAVQRTGFYGGRILITTTPYNMGWLKRDVYDTWQEGDADYCVVNFPSTANPRYPKEAVERARRTMSETRFRMLYEGKFGRPEGMIYDCFEDDANLVDDFSIPPDWERVGGIDFGFNNPTAAVFLARNEDGVYYLSADYKRREAVMADHAADLVGKGGERWIWYGDPAAAQNILEMRRLGLTVVEANNDVSNGIDTVYGLIKSRRLRIMRSCKATLDELGSYAWKKDAKSGDLADEPIKENDHLMDALRYALHSVEKGGGLRLHV